MKKTILLGSLALAFVSNSSAQKGGLNRLKDKAKEATKKEETTPAQNITKINGNNDGDSETSAEAAESKISAIASAGNWDNLRKVPMGYTDYITMRDAYQANPKKQKYYLDKIPACDQYYSEWIPKVLKESILPDLESTYKTTQNKKQSQASWVIRECKSSLFIIEMYLPAKPNDPILEKYKKDFQQLQTEEEEYISSGAEKRYQESEKNAEIAAIRMPKAEAKNPSWEKSAKDLIEQSSEGGPVLKVVLADNGWNIVKNDFGIPEERNQHLYVAYKSKESGKCYYTRVNATQQYAGAGTYNAKTNFYGNETIEILCENVSK